MEIFPIAHIESEFASKFGIPRQSGLAPDLTARIIFEPEYRNPEAFRGLEDVDCIWLIWEFSEFQYRGFSPTVRPPRLGGNRRMGVFATRSPNRPNSLGLSCVKLERIELSEALGPVLIVSGADLMSGTPIYDIKPYLPYCESHPEARGGFAEDVKGNALTVEFLTDIPDELTDKQVAALSEVLSQDPRPHYHDDPERIYGMPFLNYDVKFSVKDDLLTVTGIKAMV